MKVVIFGIIVARNDGHHFLVLIKVEEVLGGYAFANTARIGDLVATEAVDLTKRREEEVVGVGLGVDDEAGDVAGGHLHAG
jgi:hypothetical protein